MCHSCSEVPWEHAFLHTLNAEAWGAKHYWSALHLLLHGRKSEEEFFLAHFSAVVNSSLSVRILWPILLTCPLQILLIGLRFLFLNHPLTKVGKTLLTCSLPAEHEWVLHFCPSGQDNSVFRQCFTKLTKTSSLLQSARGCTVQHHWFAHALVVAGSAGRQLPKQGRLKVREVFVSYFVPSIASPLPSNSL